MEPFYQPDSMLTLYKGDALKVLPSLHGVDCVVTDPAYWTLNKWREIGTTTRLGGHRDKDKREGWFDTIDHNDLWEMVCTFSLLLPKNAHAWICCDDETSDYLTGYVRHDKDGTNFTYCKRFPVIKLRADGQGYKPGMGYHGRATHEYVVLLEKGRNRMTELGTGNFPDVFSVPWAGDAETRKHTPDGKPYPTAKPVALMQQFIELSSKPGETILDPFMGGGSTVIAAQRSGRKVIGIDISDAAHSTTRSRILGEPTEGRVQISDTAVLPRLPVKEPAVRHSGDGSLRFDGW